MLKLLNNITQITDITLKSSFYKIWTTTTIISYVSVVYIFCLLIICLCLYCNRRNNLIYKVLNLAVLSVFVVALWSYLTDMTFIYIVYILTFVSAVVMLFLSVVLMLPSSAVVVRTRLNFSLLTAVSISNLVYTIVQYGADFMLLLFSWMVLVSVYYYVRMRWIFEHGHLIRRSIILRLIWANIRTILKYWVKRFFIWLFSKLNIEMFLQACTSLSVFLLAVPHGNFNTRKIDFSAYLNSYASNLGVLENLSNIQYELYIKSPFLMLVCVVGLLVALLGAALLVSTKILNSK